eukprot:TRINITY_DN8029_c0_g1_i2.p1 TRINITY_DN8029_c0_g1~~TRINITY_DN8029_c0_g1_i2.p1  ORF type:complete len:430 (+),score=73.30 TRINITY_DN8029_c0_g1_i2:85-1290(+)
MASDAGATVSSRAPVVAKLHIAGEICRLPVGYPQDFASVETTIAEFVSLRSEDLLGCRHFAIFCGEGTGRRLLSCDVWRECLAAEAAKVPHVKRGQVPLVIRLFVEVQEADAVEVVLAAPSPASVPAATMDVPCDGSVPSSQAPEQTQVAAVGAAPSSHGIGISGGGGDGRNGGVGDSCRDGDVRRRRAAAFSSRLASEVAATASREATLEAVRADRRAAWQARQQVLGASAGFDRADHTSAPGWHGEGLGGIGGHNRGHGSAGGHGAGRAGGYGDAGGNGGGCSGYSGAGGHGGHGGQGGAGGRGSGAAERTAFDYFHVGPLTLYNDRVRFIRARITGPIKIVGSEVSFENCHITGPMHLDGSSVVMVGSHHTGPVHQSGFSSFQQTNTNFTGSMTQSFH